MKPPGRRWIGAPPGTLALGPTPPPVARALRSLAPATLDGTSPAPRLPPYPAPREKKCGQAETLSPEPACDAAWSTVLCARCPPSGDNMCRSAKGRLLATKHGRPVAPGAWARRPSAFGESPLPSTEGAPHGIWAVDTAAKPVVRRKPPTRAYGRRPREDEEHHLARGRFVFPQTRRRWTWQVLDGCGTAKTLREGDGLDFPPPQPDSASAVETAPMSQGSDTLPALLGRAASLP
ncbi:hypothetical protein CDD83_7797 [Cordyceps sp. RAO-2017]|nr:hypothetical protein CDD83_7797 [Cordyceps sp. RAO-2017]